MGLDEITLAFFVERADEVNRAQYEGTFEDEAGVRVQVVFIETGEWAGAVGQVSVPAHHRASFHTCPNTNLPRRARERGRK